MVITFIRGLATLILGTLCTLVICVVGILLGALQGVLRICGIRTSFEVPIFYYWSAFIHEICLVQVLGVKVIMSGYIPPARDREVLVCISNHPSTLVSPSLAWYVSHFLSERMLTVAKIEHLRNPFGWCLWVLNTAIFVDRTNPLQSKKAIRVTMSNGVPTPCTLILLPDSGRPSAEVIAKDIQKFAGKIPRIADWLKYTRAPRAGGLHSAVQALSGKRARYVDVTIALRPGDDSCVLNILWRGDWILHIHAEEVSPPQERQTLEEWLNRSFEQKNSMIGRW